ncbi:MAG: PAS domain S-box protein, partial [Acidimicrobiia bacterium]
MTGEARMELDMASTEAPGDTDGLSATHSTQVDSASGAGGVRETNLSVEIVSEISQCSSEAVIGVDMARSIVVFNGPASDVFGYDGHEIIGQPLRTLLPERYRAGHDSDVRDFAEGKVSARAIRHPALWGRRQNGEQFPADVGITRIGIGADVTMMATVRDVTAAHETMVRLHESQRRLQTIFDGCPIALWLEDYGAVNEWLEGLRAGGLEDLRGYLQQEQSELDRAIGMIKVL